MPSVDAPLVPVEPVWLLSVVPEADDDAEVDGKALGVDVDAAQPGAGAMALFDMRSSIMEPKNATCNITMLACRSVVTSATNSTGGAPWSDPLSHMATPR